VPTVSPERSKRAELDSRVVIVADADTQRGGEIARAMSALHAAVLIAGSDVDALGELAAELAALGTRVAVLVDDVATDSGRAVLVEMVNELFSSPA
jgi:NAD(P)-dependent dehydrogenase (short-subunit alcohol dehydrogenase family)